MTLNDSILNLELEIKNVLQGMKSIGDIPYFEKVAKGRLENVDIFPCAFFWRESSVNMGNDYITGDLVRIRYIIAGYDYDISTFDNYQEAETRSLKLAADLRDEFSKWENRNLNGTVFQSQVVEIYVDPGSAPFSLGEGGLMAAGGIELLVIFREGRAA